jgi:replicative DNA helicase
MNGPIDSAAELARMGALYRHDERIEQLRMPPQSVEAEQAVLGGVMLTPHAWPMVGDLLVETDFYRRDHQMIWRAIKALAERNRPFDAVTIGEFFEARQLGEYVAGGAYLVELASTTPSAANIVAYAEIVADKARLRKMIEVGTSIVNDGFDSKGRDSEDILADMQAKLIELQPAQRGGLKLVSETLNSWYGRYCERYGTQAQMTGLPTPWKQINEITRGLQPATLYLIAGRPSMGKSVMGLNLAQMTSLRGKTVAFFSLEMSEDDCHNRNIAALARVPHDWILAPNAESDHTPAVSDALRRMREAQLYIDDMPAITVRQFEARARRMNQRTQIDLLVIDHIHDFKIDPKLARFEYGAIAQAAKNLGKEWNIPVVALAQLNRNTTDRKGDKRPTLSDLRESGELEQKADVVILMHREDYYDSPDDKTHLQGVVEAHVAKGRNIRSGARVYLRNRFDQMRLDDWEGPLPQAPSKKNKSQDVGYGSEELPLTGRDRAAGPDR